ncbi:hypothetical protein AB2L28_20650 [Kineococcus sp. TBRC 1896]|uniref:Cell wall assembly regulator SMI1 n=1 Tax=Kineococcus mangrovi TaxID=1660183 RepID=A0ABV4I7J7_9ACTN
MNEEPSVEAAWARITAWLRTHAPATAASLHPPAPARERALAEERTGVLWPEQLRTWFSLHDRWDRDAGAAVLPGWPGPMSLTRALDDRQLRLKIEQDVTADDEDAAEHRAEVAQQEAGQIAGAFLPAFIALDENQSGDALFVDCRRGPRHGCVTEWIDEAFDGAGPVWWSIAQMLSDVADHLEQQTPCRYWRPQVEDGAVRWELDDLWDSTSRCLARAEQ